MAGKEYTAKDKIFSKMTREGLTEETLRESSVKKISQKSRDEPDLDSKKQNEENAAPGKRLSDSSGRTNNQRMRRYVQELRIPEILPDMELLLMCITTAILRPVHMDIRPGKHFWRMIMAAGRWRLLPLPPRESSMPDSRESFSGQIPDKEPGSFLR